MAYTFTHTAQVTGRQTVDGGCWIIRETARFWISSDGFRFRKIDGTEAAEWPTLRLHLATIKAV